MQQSASPRLNELERRYVELTQKSAADYAPSALTQARLILIRAKREFAAGLEADAELSASQLENLILYLETRWPPAPTHSKGASTASR